LSPASPEEDVVDRLVTCIWYDGGAEQAARFYAAIFPDTRVTAVNRAPADYPAGRAGDVLTVDFTLLGQSFTGMNGGPGHPPTDAVSFTVLTEDQAETDRYWDALTADGGQEVACGWCRDRWGVAWQIIPRALAEAWRGPDRAAAARAFEAMMGMTRIDIAAIERAVAGA
jgi:predicted 3-demethylubiquinone-9 3-methyltransferase (glyoxalase superfamily)